ncbi:MAG: CBS domain-containing protein [Ancrocorticia sp.]
MSEIINSKGGVVVTLPPNATINQLVGLLADYRIGTVLVQENERLVGIVSERDVVRTIRAAGSLSSPVSAIMTADVTTCSPEDDVRDIAATMTRKRIRHIPVVDGGKVLTVVSVGDLLKSFLDEASL